MVTHAQSLITRKPYAVWFKDNDEGNEDHITVLATEAEAATLTEHLQSLKQQGAVSDFVVILDSPYTLADGLAYIDEKLEVEA